MGHWSVRALVLQPGFAEVEVVLEVPLNAKIRQNADALWRIRLRPDVPHARAVSGEGLGRSRLGGGRNGRDRLQDLRSDLVGVALRVRAAIFQIALVAVIDEGMRHPDRGAAVRDTE